MFNRRSLAATLVLVLAATLPGAGFAQAPQRVEGAAAPGPRYAVDPYWPRPLPKRWILGQVSGIASDSRDHIWVLHRPRTATEDERSATLTPPRSKCCIPAPAVIEFDREGNLLQAWGGPGQGYQWPKNEHGIYVDPAGNVWVGGNGNTDHQILKFTRDGKFLLQIGHSGASEGSNSTTQLGRPAHMELDAANNELFVADGYQNKRVIVFDAGSGAYKRHWGAYGKKPDDARLPYNSPESPQFGNPVHCVRQTRDGLLYVCDRANNRIQIFRKNGEFVRQIVLEPKTLGLGSAWDLIPTEDPGQRYLLVADGSNNEVHILVRASGERIGSFGRNGRNAGDFHWVHNIAIDSQGSVYTSEVDTGKRAQRFRRVQ